MSKRFGNHGTNCDGFQDEPAATLSGAGTARRNSMLSILQDAVIHEGGRRRARRIAIRRAGSLCLVAVLGVSLVIGWPTSKSSGPVVDNGSTADVAQDSTRIVLLNSEPGALERYAYVTPIDPAEYIVDDHAFLAVLASIGRPTGLVHRGGRVMLTSFTPDPIRIPAPVEQDGASEADTSAQRR